jgi:hypothetical protein
LFRKRIYDRAACVTQLRVKQRVIGVHGCLILRIANQLIRSIGRSGEPLRLGISEACYPRASKWLGPARVVQALRVAQRRVQVRHRWTVRRVGRRLDRCVAR